jgi:hypothetical protein
MQKKQKVIVRNLVEISEVTLHYKDRKAVGGCEVITTNMQFSSFRGRRQRRLAKLTILFITRQETLICQALSVLSR